jgi:hypothetical protein
MELVFGSFIPRPPHEAGIAGRKWQGDDIEAVAAVLAVITTVGERIAAIPEAPKRISITSDNICHIKSTGVGADWQGRPESPIWTIGEIIGLL